MFFVVSCEKKSTSSEVESDSNTNTLNENHLGLDESNFSDYYFNLNSNFSAKYLYYQKESPTISTIDYPNLLDPNRDTLGLKSFPDYILKVDADTIGLDFTTTVPFDETQNGCSEISDDCPDIDGNNSLTDTYHFPDKTQVDSVTIDSGGALASYDKLSWDRESGRYKPSYVNFEDDDGNILPYLVKDTVIYIENIFRYDSLVYIAFIDTMITGIEGQFYFDEAEYVKRDSTFDGPEIELSATFDFMDLVIQSSADTIINRVNTDCDLNGEQTLAETLIADYNGDNLYDIVPEFNDINGNGILDEPAENTIKNYNNYNEDGSCSFEDTGLCINSGGESGINLQTESECCDSNGGVWDSIDSICTYTNCNDCNWEMLYELGCDDDMSDIHYEFVDRGNEKFDRSEIFWDEDNDQIYDLAEPFEDLNCNGIWDTAEIRTDNANNCDIYREDSDGGFCDTGNGQWDDVEYIDPIGGQLSRYNDGESNNLLVDYSDPENPIAVPVIDIDTAVKLRDSGDGVLYHPLESVDSTRVIIDNSIKEIERVETIFSNQVIMQSSDSSLFDKEFHILKSEYPSNSSNNNYNYSILNMDDHLYSLRYASYFLPYGFYFTPSEVRGGFWFEDNLSIEAILYLYDGKIREGEHITLDSIYVTSHGDYQIETDYFVERQDLIVLPMREVLLDSQTNTCYSDPETSSNSDEQCLDILGTSAFDSTLYNIYKVTKTTTMTMLGSGVEYGERTTSYLAEGIGLVKEELEIRWSEQIGMPNQVWYELSKIELAELRIDDSAERKSGILENLMGEHNIEIDELNQLDGNPFIKKRTVGIQPVMLPAN